MVMSTGSIPCSFSVINVYNVSNATHQAPLTNLAVVISLVVRVRRSIASLHVRTYLWRWFSFFEGLESASNPKYWNAARLMDKRSGVRGHECLGSTRRHLFTTMEQEFTCNARIAFMALV